MRKVPGRNRWSHDAADMSREERQSLSGTAVQTPAAGSGEDWRRGEQKEEVGKRTRDEHAVISNIWSYINVC